MLDFYGLSNLFATITNLGISFLVYTKGRSSKLAKIWAVFTLCVAIYGFGGFMASGAKNYDSAFFWWRFSYVGVILLPALFTHFVYTFLEIRRSVLVNIVYFMTIIIWFANIFSKSLFIGNVTLIFTDSKWFTPAWFVYPPGPFHIFHTIVLYFVLLTYLFVRLVLAYKHSDPLKRTQIKYFTIAMVLGFYGGGCSYLPCFGINIYPIPNITVPLYTFLIGFAIIRHQLMGIDVIIKRTLVFTGLLVSVFAMLILPTLLIQEYILRAASTSSRTIGLTISGIIIILTMRRIENFLVNITDKYLFQKKYDYKELLKIFTAEVLTLLELDKLLNLTVEKLTDTVRIDLCAIVLADKETGMLNIAAEKGENKLISMLPAKEDITRLISMGKGYELLKDSLLIPMVLHGEMTGVVLLGKKRSDESYTQDDLDILLPLAKTLAIAISNAELFAELGKAHAEASQREKMAVLGTLAAGMAHEIRNPITTIKIFTEFLKEKKDDPNFIEKFEKLVPKEVEKINHMITSLLEFSKPADGTIMEKVDVKAALKEVVDISGNEMILNDIILEDNISGIPQVYGNKKHIQEIFFNLIENAIHSIGRRGKIIISVEDTGSSVKIYIKDTGRGISEDNISHIFEPFFTTKMDSKGVGLGLYVIKQLIVRMEGGIEVKSEPAKGATFILRFKKA